MHIHCLLKRMQDGVRTHILLNSPRDYSRHVKSRLLPSGPICSDKEASLRIVRQAGDGGRQSLDGKDLSISRTRQHFSPANQRMPLLSMSSNIELASCVLASLALMLRNQGPPSSSSNESRTALRLPVNSLSAAAADSAPSAFLSFFHTSHKYHPFLHRCPTLFLLSSPSIEAFACLLSQYLLSPYLTIQP